MNDQLVPAILASLCCLGMFAGMAGVVGLLAELRMRSAERALDRPAVPANETALLVYALASFVWVSAAGVAVVGLAKREWARMGRNATLIFLTHMLLAVLAALAQVMNDATGHRGTPTGIIVGAALIVAGSALMMATFGWRWASARASRVETEPPSGESALGPERYAIYAAALLFWPAGLLAPLVLRSPERVRVGAHAFACSLVNILVIALGTCAAIVVLAVTQLA